MRLNPIIVALFAGACGAPQSGSQGSADGGDGEAGTDVDASGAIEGGDETGADEPGDDETGAGDPSAGDTGTLEDACLHEDPDACPAGCYRGEVLRVEDDACTTSTVAACLPGGEQPGAPITTFWNVASSGPVFVEHGSPCGAPAQPEGWRECSGAADEPEECACFCQAGYCPGDDDRRVLESCELPVTCETLLVVPRHGAADHEVERCFLEQLRDRIPGVYEIFGGNVPGTMRTRFYVVGEQLWRIQEATADGGADGCPTRSDWGRAELCTLAAADYFESCLEPAAPGEDCVLMLDAWALECVEQAPSCG